MRVWLKVLVLFALGAYFAYNVVSGNLANYINTQLAWLSLVAAALFWLLALVSARDALQAHAHDTHSDGHAHSHLSWLVLLIALIPLALGVLVPSRPLGAEAVAGDNAALSVAVENNSVLKANRLEWTILDWRQAFYTSDDLDSFNGQPADVIGFVYPRDELPEGRFMLGRFMLSCCAADAFVIGLPVIWNTPPAPNTWVRVRGKMQVGELDDETTLILQAESVEAIDEPDVPYLYP
jgi:uncharacterized repeat protein (TIGR03943 family)